MDDTASRRIIAACADIARELEQRRERLHAEISNHPPAAARDANFNRLLEEDAEVSAELGRFTALREEYPQAVTLRTFVQNSRSLDAETRQRLLAALRDVNS